MCIENDEVYIKIDELIITNDELYITNDEGFYYRSSSYSVVITRDARKTWRRAAAPTYSR